MSRRSRYAWVDLKPFAEDPAGSIVRTGLNESLWRDCLPLMALMREFGISGRRSCVYQFIKGIANGTGFSFDDFDDFWALKDARKTDKPTYHIRVSDTGIRISILNYMAHNPRLVDANASDHEMLTKNLGDWSSAYNYINDASGNTDSLFADWRDLLYLPCGSGDAAGREKRAKELMAGKYAYDDALTARVDAACAKLREFCAKHPLTASEVTDGECDVAMMFYLFEDYYIKAGMKGKADSLIVFHFDRMMSADLKGAFAGNANPEECASAYMRNNFPLNNVFAAHDCGSLHYPEILMGYYDRLSAYARDGMTPKDKSAAIIRRALSINVLPAFVTDFRYWTTQTDRYDDAQIDGMIEWYNARRGDLCDLSLIRMIDKMPSPGEFSNDAAMRMICMLDQSMPLISQCVIDARRSNKYHQHNYGREKNMLMWLLCYCDDMPVRMRERFAGTLAKYVEMKCSSQAQIKTVMGIIKATADNPLSLIAAIGDRCKSEKTRNLIAELMLS